MAVSFPLSSTAFWDLLPIASCVLDLPGNVTISRTRGGEILAAEIGTRLWSAEVRLGQMTRDEAADVLPLLNLLRGAGGSFMMGDPLRAFPRMDAKGTSLGSANVTLTSVGTNRREISLGGLPNGYTLKRRDLLAFSYASNPVRYALHEVVTGSIAAGAAGNIIGVEVSPPVRQGVALGAAVTLKRPAMKAIVDPQSFQAGSVRSGALIEGVSFRAIQTLR